MKPYDVYANEKCCALCGYPIMKHRCPPYDATPEERGPTGLWCPTDVRLKNPLMPLESPDDYNADTAQ